MAGGGGKGGCCGGGCCFDHKHNHKQQMQILQKQLERPILSHLDGGGTLTNVLKYDNLLKARFPKNANIKAAGSCGPTQGQPCAGPILVLPTLMLWRLWLGHLKEVLLLSSCLPTSIHSHLFPSNSNASVLARPAF